MSLTNKQKFLHFEKKNLIDYKRIYKCTIELIYYSNFIYN
jgi:hypothetical protein